MYLLRAITLYKDTNDFLADSWHEFDTPEAMLKYLIKIDPDEYQCFEAGEITNEIFLKVEKQKSINDKEDRRKQYEALKLEFEKES